MKQKITNWLDRKWIAAKLFLEEENAGMGTVEIILIICSVDWLSNHF